MNEMKRLLSFVRRATDDYNMIEEGDRIAVGVSGGKDSLALLSALAAMRYVQCAPMRKIFSFSLKSPDALSSFARGAETYALNHLERSFDTLDFYKNVKD